MRLVLLSLLLAACPSPAPKKEATMPPVITSASDLKAALGKTVVLSGRAENAKLSGVVFVGEAMIYCLDVGGWPDGVAGGVVTVEGRLEETRDFEVKVGPDGAVSQGTMGAITVLRDCKPR